MALEEAATPAEEHSEAEAANRPADEFAPIQSALPGPDYDTAKLVKALYGSWADLRTEWLPRLGTLWTDEPRDLSVDELRARTLDRLFRLVEFGGIDTAFVTVEGRPPQPGRGLTLFELIASIDPSLVIKMGVQFGLYGGAITRLGTEKHHARYLPQIGQPEGMGCFAMTEVGHGSNVQGLRTTATYNSATGEFVVDTPDADARKDYIGNAARDGRTAVVFAQLHVDGTGHGVHALMVPLRDETGATLPGITIEDDGGKAGLNGVDNGRVTFDAVPVPREALLDRYASVSEDGTYSSSIANPDARFFTMVGTLVAGRVAVAAAANGTAKTGLKIAVHHGLTRRQFGESGNEEQLLLDYQLHQDRLLPRIARAYAMNYAVGELIDDVHETVGVQLPVSQQRRLETRTAALKVLATNAAYDTLDEMRLALGGSGFLSENQIAGLRGDCDVFRTFEGDNNVLLLFVAKSILTNYKEDFAQLGTVGKARFAAQSLIDDIREHTPVRHAIELGRSFSRRPNGGEALRQEDHVRRCADLEKHITGALADRFRAGIRGGATVFAAFAAVQVHAAEAARLHGENLALQAFVRAIARCEDRETAALLGKLCDLHAVTVLDDYGKLFLQHGLMNARESKGISRAKVALQDDLRPYAETLVDGFGIPDEWITAPAGKRPPNSSSERVETRASLDDVA